MGRKGVECSVQAKLSKAIAIEIHALQHAYRDKERVEKDRDPIVHTTFLDGRGRG
jgi:hypothetical protein